MQVQVENVDGVTRRLKVVLPKERVETELEQVYRQLQRDVTVKGYRKGKAPRPVLERIYRPRVEADVTRQLVEQSYAKAVEEGKLSPVASPVIHETRLKRGEEFSYTATVEVKPAFELPGYKGFEVKVPRPPITDADVEEQVKGLAERRGQLVPVLEDRPVGGEDVAIVDYETFVGGAPSREPKSEGVTLELGKGILIDEFERALPGMKIGETRAVEVAFPADHADEKLAGKRVLYRVTLKEIKRREIPAIDDAFAREVNAENLDDLRAKIRVEIEAHRAEERKKEVRRQLLDRVLEKLQVELPKAMVDRQLRALYQSAQNVLGGDRVLDRRTFESLKDRLKSEAERRVRELLVLEAISAAEGLSVTEADVEAQFERIGQRYGQSPAAVRAFYMQEGRLPALVNMLAEEKTLDFLENASRISD